MSRQIAEAAINLEFASRIASQESLDHPEFIKQITGIDPFEKPAEATLAACDALNIDWLFYVPMQSLRVKPGETVTRESDGMQFVEWGFTGSHWEDEPPFKDVDEILVYNPLEDQDGKVYVVSEAYRRARIEDARVGRELAGDRAFVSGLYYTTLFQFNIMAFGFENFLIAAMSDPQRFDEILDQFTQISIANLTEWVKDDCPICVCHDDLAIGQGLVFPPDWYRQHIFPRYERIFEPIKKAGKKLIFVSDGNYMDLIDDLLSLGADGLLVDCFMDLDAVFKKCGPERIVIGNIDTRILTNGTPSQIKAEVRRCVELGSKYPGYVFRAAGDLPHNIPLENMQAYFDAKREFGQR